jgi:hypothetical protein
MLGVDDILPSSQDVIAIDNNGNKKGTLSKAPFQ